ncbi:hypothetical protein MTR72_24725 [Bradyrhizobium sp. ISRA442]|uniref:hypothetical protein n=1 Tax=Bradyrhizobium sp. ISRA442 TaxID=2866197 RepID=UPI00311B0335
MTTYSYITIDDPAGYQYTIPESINASGQITGYYQDFQLHGFVYSGGTYTTIDGPSDETTPFSINDLGQITGIYYDSSGSADHGFLFSGGTYTTIDDPLGINTVPRSINNSG